MPYLGQPPHSGENNNFKILDTISSYTLTFDGIDSTIVSASDDTLTFYDHRFVQGQRVTYTHGGGAVINGLANNTAYFIIKEDKNTIKLATTAARAASGTAEDLSLSGTSGSSHTLNVAFDGVNTKFKATHTNGKHAKITRAAQLVLSVNGVIQQPHDSTSPSTGFGIHSNSIVFSQAPQSTDAFWGHILTNNNVTFDISDNTIDHFSGDGSSTEFTLSKIPLNNENVLVTIDGVVQYPNDNAGNIRSYGVTENVITFVSAPASATQIEVRHIGFAAATSGDGVTGFYGRTGNVALKNTDNITVNNATATTFIGNITGTAGTFTGNVSIGGTLTYEDVTNIDSVGIITAQSGIDVTGGRVKIGTGTITEGHASADDLTIATTGNTGITIRSGTTSNGAIFFSDAESGDAEFDGFIQYNHGTNPSMLFGTSDDEQLRITGFGSFGFGTNNPLTPLHIKNLTAKSSGTYTGGVPDTASVRIEDKGTTDNYYHGVELRSKRSGDIRLFAQDMGTNKSDFCLFTDNAGTIQESLRITSDGKMGIGTDLTTTPSSVLTIAPYNSTSGRNISIYTSGAVGNKAGIFFNSTSGTGNLAEIQAEYKGTNEGELVLSTSMQKRITIQKGGNVGIGSENPGKHLDVYRNGLVNARIKGNVAGGLGAELILQNANAAANGYSEIQFQDSGTNVFSKIRGFNLTDGSNNGYMALYTASATEGLQERVRISDAGNVGIGTDDPNSIIHATGSNSSVGYQFINTHATSGFGVKFKGGGSTADRYSLRVDNAADEELFRVNANGKVGIGTYIPSQELTVYGADPIISVQEASVSSQVDIGTGTVTGFINIQKADGTRNVQITANGDTYFKGGDVGIGTNNPDTEFHVYDGDSLLVSLFESETHDSRLRIKAPSTKYSQIEFADDDADTGEIRYDHTDDSMQFFVNSNSEKLRIKSTGEVHISDRNNANAGTHFFQAGSYGIRMNDINSYNHWYIERNYGGFQSIPQVTLKASGHTGFNILNPTSVIHGQDDSATETIILKLRNYKASVNTKPSLRFEAATSSGQGANSTIQGLAGTDAGGVATGNESGMKFIVTYGGSGTEREAFSLKKDGNMYFPDGQGINFGATAGGSATSGILHDYEEGIWTPTVHQGIDGGASYAMQRGWYIKVGGLVQISWFLRFVNSTTGSTGNGNHFKMTGLPYNSADLSPAYSSGGVVTYTNVNFNNSAYQVLFNIYGNSTVMEFHSARASAAGISGANQSKDIYGFGTYRTNS